ncbi:GDSL-type esterase/lipase family protein [Nocardia sienata]|uniref:GDSL-type esterase/lipase family protein n=1 Tax=Nocardia sienata TaxID=248552 RepID=UPI000A05582F|nr:GDSL-type esterase/lipase family protein [Nocardia sienata]
MGNSASQVNFDGNSWLAGFRSGVISPDEQIALTEPRAFADQTIRQFLRLAGGGSRVRVRLTNRYGRTPLRVRARIAIRSARDEIDAATDTPLRFAGAEEVWIEPGAEVVSDPIDWATTAGTTLALSLYLPESTGLATYSHMPQQTAYVAPGNQSGAVLLTGAEPVAARFFVTGVDVYGPASTPVTVAFGDSWFEGVGTTPDTDRRSVDIMNRRLPAGWVVNQGISGNRLLRAEIGESGLARFDRDVLAVPGVRRVLLHFGINDLILGGMAGQPPATAAELIAGFTDLARRAHRAGLAVHAATIGPFGGSVFPKVTAAEGSPIRREVNEWLRRTDVFDSVADLAAAVADPADPDRIHPVFDSGDGTHLNDRGAAVMAETLLPMLPEFDRVIPGRGSSVRAGLAEAA